MGVTIAMAGKGGTGKTTLAGLAVKYLLSRDMQPVLAVDADSNSNLNEVLGLEVEATLGDAREEMKKGGLPGMTAFATRMMKQQMADLEIPDVPQFLDMLAAAGAHFYACKLTFDMMKMIEADLHDATEGVISAADFVEISEGAQIIFI